MAAKDSSAGASAGFNRTPLAELSRETRRQLASTLNRKRVFHSEDGYERDWRGIASLAGLRDYIGENVSKPMDVILSSWIMHNPQTADVGHLEQFLGIIDRGDVRDDIQENLTKDTDRYNIKQQQLEQLALARDSPPPHVKCMERNNNTLGQNVKVLSFDDEKWLQTGQPLPRYNACVLYAEADIEHATDIMSNLESPPYNLKLFLRHRDLLVGVELSQFMPTQCNHLIVVMTDEFLESRENTYLDNFTQKLQIENHSCKIIPILYKQNMTIPKTLATYRPVSYADHSNLFNFWDKLARSLQAVDPASICRANPQINSISTASTPDPIALPEKPPILMNDDSKQTAAESKPKTIPGTTTAALPELKVKRKDKLLQKFKINFNTSPRNGSVTNDKQLIHSSSAINVHQHNTTLGASMYNLSTYSENKKRSNKWRSKLLKKFTRTSTKFDTLLKSETGKETQLK